MLARMAPIYACRIDLETVGHALFIDYMPEYTLRSRRTAYIPQAHEKDFVFLIVIQIVGSIHVFMVYTTVYNIFNCIFSNYLQR